VDRYRRTLGRVAELGTPGSKQGSFDMGWNSDTRKTREPSHSMWMKTGDPSWFLSVEKGLIKAVSNTVVDARSQAEDNKTRERLGHSLHIPQRSMAGILRPQSCARMRENADLSSRLGRLPLSRLLEHLAIR